jgi:hypothetical protein
LQQAHCSRRCARDFRVSENFAAPAGMKKTGPGRRSRRRSTLRIADPISLRLDIRMAPKYHPTPLSGGDRKTLAKELGNARAMANILASQSAEMRAKGEAMIQQADKLLCESWNGRMWSDGEPIDPSLTIDQAVNRGYVGNLAPMPGVFPDHKAPFVLLRAQTHGAVPAFTGMVN